MEVEYQHHHHQQGDPGACLLAPAPPRNHHQPPPPAEGGTLPCDIHVPPGFALSRNLVCTSYHQHFGAPPGFPLRLETTTT